jgi:reticulon-1
MSDYQEESSSTHDLLPDEVEQFSKLAEEITSQFKEQHTPSAPPSDDNGYIVVPSQQQQPVATAAVESSPHEEDTVVLKKADASNAQSTTGCNTCPYYFLGLSSLSKVHIPPKVEDLLLWKCPKYSGAVFGSTLVVLLSLATFTLLSVVSTLLLLALTGVGAYRFYLSVLFRIKGTYDDTFDKISSTDFSLPKDKIQELARLLDTDINRVINQLKSIILWDNLATSAVAYFVVYLVYCVASVFNTITLLILVHLAAFSLPKVYQVYKVQIDQTIQQATEFAHKTAEDIMAKLPFLKKKVQ